MKWNGATQNEGPTDMLMMLPAGMMGGPFQLGGINAKGSKGPTEASDADMGSRVKDNPTQYVRDEFCRMGFDDYDIVSRRLRRAEMPLKNNSLKLVNFPSAISYVRHKELK
ncbi:hypothetical protein PF008_g14949 [Phytophthora fragariae]|uniref:Uncharacterized protein n=1 Tax=Phytophthora fragariae TaxID=53985 RepID=A0A6G0RG13_9STRA|nr:hypothetical protein PF008_g14949 [Phytophthora fragariae]